MIAVLILAGAYFLIPRPAPGTAPKVAGVVERQSRALCSLDPARSFNTPLGTPSVAFTIDPARGCENAWNPYERTAAGFSRIIPNAGAGVVSTLDIAADLTTLQRRDFPLSAKESAALHVALGPSKALRCSPSDAPATIAAIRSRLARMRALAQPYLSRRPVRQITWRCRP